MLREFRTNCAAAPQANLKADVAMKTGMGVIKDEATGKVKLPTSATAKGIFVVQKAPVATGIYAGQTNFSDYFEQFHNVEKDEPVVATYFLTDDVFGTDQYADAITASTAAGYVEVGTDGKWKTASGATRYYFTGLVNDNGHTLARIRVVE